MSSPLKTMALILVVPGGVGGQKGFDHLKADTLGGAGI